MNLKTILITGGTGSLGKLLVKEIKDYKANVVFLVRADSQKEAEQRVESLWEKKENCTVLQCDLTQKNLGLSKQITTDLQKKVTHILHAAASTRFSLPISDARRNNVDTTKNIILFAKTCGNLQKFGFVSTAYVAGKRSGLILEDEFTHTQGFLNTYEQSKYEAEAYVRSEKNFLPLQIFRPSLVVTPFNRASKSPVSAVSLGLFLAKQGFLPLLPGTTESRLDIIDGTIVAKAIVSLFFAEKFGHLTYHVTTGKNSITIGQLLTMVKKQTGKNLPVRFCGDAESFDKALKKTIRFRPDLAVMYRKTESFLKELAYSKMLDNTNLLEDLHLTSIDTPIEQIQLLLK
jgi:thioester reductase-like protein